MNLFVNFACNDDRGHFVRMVAKIDLEDLDGKDICMEIEGPSRLEIYDDGSREFEATTPMIVNFHTSPREVVIDPPESQVRIQMRTYGKWTGSCVFNGGEIEVEQACKLVNFLRKTGEWSCTTGWSDLFWKFEKGAIITAQDFGAPEPAAERCPLTVPMQI